MRVHEPARELGWAPRQLLEELNRRGEFVKCAASTLEASIVRAIRPDFAAVSKGPDFDAAVTPEMYGKSAEPNTTEESDDSFAAAVARVKPRSSSNEAKRKAQWRTLILQFILDETIVPRRPARLDNPNGSDFR